MVFGDKGRVRQAGPLLPPPPRQQLFYTDQNLIAQKPESSRVVTMSFSSVIQLWDNNAMTDILNSPQRSVQVNKVHTVSQ